MVEEEAPFHASVTIPGVDSTERITGFHDVVAKND